MIRKKIAVLIGQAEENTQNRFMQGFLKEAFRNDYDVCVFSMFLKYQDNPKREVGESNIFNLIQYDQFDAIVMLSDTIQTSGVIEKLEKKIKEEFDGPVLVVDKESQYFESVMMDHRKPLQELVDHLIEVHGYKDIYFLNGFKEHLHSKQRLQGYIDSMENHGLEVTEDMIFYGTYWYTSGAHMVSELVNERKHIPEAIVCANDCMAIGVCGELEKQGYKIPEDVAVIGYDSISDGINSPVAITSAEMPAEDCGRYTARLVDCKLTEKKMKNFDTKVKLIIGGSCGCEDCTSSILNLKRKNWATDVSDVSYYSCYNNMMENLLAQDDYQSLFNTVFQYIYQIRDFESFHICLNDTWKKPETCIGKEAIRYGYSDKMYRIIKCGPDRDTGNIIDFNDTFDSKLMLPELNDDREYPTAFFFTPLFFEDRCFGYSVINFGDKPIVYKEVYRVWIKSVMEGMESYLRQAGLKKYLDKVEASQIRDALTGLYNYRGFINKAEEIMNDYANEEIYIVLTVIDMSSTKQINANYGRKAGDKALTTLAHIINDCLQDDEVCTRMSNDEFVIASFCKENSFDRSRILLSDIIEKLDKYNKESSEDYTIEILSGYAKDKALDADEIEELVAEAVNVKNKKKQEIQEKKLLNREITEEDIKNDEIVKVVLDENLLQYHFQPILDARTGRIFGYEALMRTKTEKPVAPPVVLESAGRLGRLYDVEKATFFNVINYVIEHKKLFRDKKVFINSIPGYQLNDEDRAKLAEKMKLAECGIVVEITEGAELDDAALQRFRENYISMNIDMAVDDYGSGYSNVNNLLRYMPKYVKIDRMLLSGIHNDITKQHFVRDVIEFGRDNDIVILAEGVEIAQELEMVINLGVDLVQGYYTARPNPVVIENIAVNRVNEIIQYNQINNIKNSQKTLMVTNEKTLSIVGIVANQYRSIVFKKSFGDREITIKGAVGFVANANIKLEDGFKGTLIFENVNLMGEKGVPCIDIGKDVDVKLVLVGDNEFKVEGIRVPESSKIEFMGDGNLSINVSKAKYYAIGNDIDQLHGNIVFNQDGTISIVTNGMEGVAIGSGLGGEIEIKKGAYVIRMTGQDGVAIGCMHNKASLDIKYCDIDISFDVGKGVAIGSYHDESKIVMENLSARIVGSGTDMIALGTLEGKNTSILLSNGSLSTNLRAAKSAGVGSFVGNISMDAKYCSVKLNAQGKNSCGLAQYGNNSYVKFFNADLSVKVINSTGVDIMLDEEHTTLQNGRYEFIVNGKELERKTSIIDFE